jgi:protein phosphatase
MPLAAVVNEKIPCVHAGIFPLIQTLAELECDLVRPLVNVSSSEAAIDILWSDPSQTASGFEPNNRGTGWVFGADQLRPFLERNGLELLIRAHEWFDSGADWSFGRTGLCLTVFSSSDYCGKENKGAVAIVTENCTVQTVAFDPLYRKNAEMRRMLLPDWLISEQKPVVVRPDMDLLGEAIIGPHSDVSFGIA